MGEYKITIASGDTTLTVETDKRAIARNVKALQLENDVTIEVTREVPAKAKAVKFAGLD